MEEELAVAREQLSEAGDQRREQSKMLAAKYNNINEYYAAVKQAHERLEPLK